MNRSDLLRPNAPMRVEPFEWTSEVVNLLDGAATVIARFDTPTKIEHVELVDAEGGDIGIDYVRVGNVVLAAFAARHPVAMPNVDVAVYLTGITELSAGGLLPSRRARAKVRIRGIRMVS